MSTGVVIEGTDGYMRHKGDGRSRPEKVAYADLLVAASRCPICGHRANLKEEERGEDSPLIECENPECRLYEAGRPST